MSAIVGGANALKARGQPQRASGLAPDLAADGTSAAATVADATSGSDGRWGRRPRLRIGGFGGVAFADVGGAGAPRREAGRSGPRGGRLRFLAAAGLQPPRPSPPRPSGIDCHCGPPGAPSACRLRMGGVRRRGRGRRPQARGQPQRTTARLRILAAVGLQSPDLRRRGPPRDRLPLRPAGIGSGFAGAGGRDLWR